jgi:hypothetical protein
MVRAILEGRKAQTRRVVKFEHAGEVDAWAVQDGLWRMGVFGEGGSLADMGGIACPYGAPGDRLWVRETWALAKGTPKKQRANAVQYRATGDIGPYLRWRPSIHMPRWASRITLEVTDVRVERLNDISEEDAISEGIEELDGALDEVRLCQRAAAMHTPPEDSRVWFAELWESIHGEGSWAANPWVWVISFRRIEAKSEAA